MGNNAKILTAEVCEGTYEQFSVSLVFCEHVCTFCKRTIDTWGTGWLYRTEMGCNRKNISKKVKKQTFFLQAFEQFDLILQRQILQKYLIWIP